MHSIPLDRLNSLLVSWDVHSSLHDRRPKHHASVMLCDRANAPTQPSLPELHSTDSKRKKKSHHELEHRQISFMGRQEEGD